MRKLFTIFTTSLCLLFLGVGALAITSPIPAAAQGARGGPTCYVVIGDDMAVKYDDCNYDLMHAFGFNMEDIPNPITGCWKWGSNAGASAANTDCAVGSGTKFEVELTKPNCFDTQPSNGAFNEVDCAGFAANFDGELQNGHCYTGRENGSRYIVNEKNCATIASAQEEAREAEDAISECENGDDERSICRNDNAFVETDCSTADINNCGIMTWIYRIINFLSVGVGMVVVIGIIIGGIQYMTAGPNPQMVTAAKARIRNAIIALVAYLFLFSFLQWLVPGGLF